MTDTNTTPALLPCPVPWCGSDVLEVVRSAWSRGLCVICQSCGVRGKSLDTEAEAIAAWNRRATPATDVVEREAVARAVSQHTYAVAVGDEDCSDWPEMSERAQNVYREAADAALSALDPYRTTERATEYARGLADGVKQSEAAIVAWLRSLKTAVDVAMSDVLAGPRPDEGKSLTDRAREVIGCVSLALPIAAFAIERREHSQEAGE